VDGKIEARFAAPDARDRAADAPRAELLEGYATLHLPGLDLRLGKQIVAWGRADGINPTDNLTPRDYRVLLPYDEDQRFGAWAARATAPLTSALTLTVYASPDFQPDKVPPPTAGLPIETRRPGRVLKDLATGVKLDRSSGALDWSVSYYRGFSQLPTVEAAGPALRLGYDRTQVLGADFARNFGRYGFRGEIAYIVPADPGGVDPNADRSRLFLVAGVDRTFQENLNVNLQLLLRWAPDRDDPARLPDPAARTAATLNELIRGQEGQASPGLTFRVSDLWLNNTLRAEVFGVVNARRGDGYLRPLLSYDVSDQLRIALGANLYSGPRATPFGLLRPAGGVFAELRRGF